MPYSTDEIIDFANTLRKDYRSLNSTAGHPDSLAQVRNFTISASSPQREIPVRLYIPTETPTNTAYPILLFVHGGGWVSGDLDTHDVLIRAMSVQLNAITLSVDYRLAPEFKAFDQIDDAYAAAQWLYNNAAELNANPAQFIAAGDSAGGAIVANLAHKLRDEGQAIAAQWLLYPAVSTNLNSPSFKTYGSTHFPTTYVMEVVTQAYLPEGVSAEDPRISPFHADHHNIAPTFISVAGFDPLTSTIQQYAQQLTEQGVKNEIRLYEKQEHGFIQYFKNAEVHPLGQQAFDDGIAVLKDWLKL